VEQSAAGTSRLGGSAPDPLAGPSLWVDSGTGAKRKAGGGVILAGAFESPVVAYNTTFQEHRLRVLGLVLPQGTGQYARFRVGANTTDESSNAYMVTLLDNAIDIYKVTAGANTQLSTIERTAKSTPIDVDISIRKTATAVTIDVLVDGVSLTQVDSVSPHLVGSITHFRLANVTANTEASAIFIDKWLDGPTITNGLASANGQDVTVSANFTPQFGGITAATARLDSIPPGQTLGPFAMALGVAPNYSYTFVATFAVDWQPVVVATDAGGTVSSGTSIEPITVVALTGQPVMPDPLTALVTMSFLASTTSPVTISGTAAPNAQIALEVDGSVYENVATANALGVWQTLLSATQGVYTLRARAGAGAWTNSADLTIIQAGGGVAKKARRDTPALVTSGSGENFTATPSIAATLTTPFATPK
jgi:hypothetical protein